MLKIGVVYKITYPNGKIYVGQDRTDDCNYFGSADSFTIAMDFDQKELDDFSIRKQILFRAENISIQQLNLHEKKWIIRLRSNDPKIGYNRTGIRRQICRTVWAS